MNIYLRDIIIRRDERININGTNNCKKWFKKILTKIINKKNIFFCISQWQTINIVLYYCCKDMANHFMVEILFNNYLTCQLI